MRFLGLLLLSLSCLYLETATCFRPQLVGLHRRRRRDRRCAATAQRHQSSLQRRAGNVSSSTRNGGRTRRAALLRLSPSKDDDNNAYLPETSFGSEVVPEGQRPVNEYLDMLRKPLFDWACLESGSKGLATRLAVLYAVVFGVVCYPIAGASFTEDGYLLQKLAASNFGALMLVLFLLLRLYSGWGYVGSRLTSKMIEYEETGWYDGNMEVKPITEQKRDRFLYDSKVEPILDRLKFFTLATGGMILASTVALNVALSAKPIFNEYDPDVLERLSYDEKLAEKAAINSGGRPTYCNSRYYRAVAGGSACD